MAKKKYYTGKSKIQGKGAFANENLKPGDYIGKVHTINQLYTDYDFTDLGKSHNHSNNPNVQNVLIGNERYLMATKPIKKGQELTSNYRLQPDLEQPEDFEEAKKGKKLSASKARKILHDKSVHGKPLTDKQRKFFGAIAGGAQPYDEAQLGKLIRSIPKLNPWAFKPREGMMYRGLGKEGMKDALESGLFRSRQNTEVVKKGNFTMSKQFGNPYFSPSFETAKNYGQGYIAEVPISAANWRRRYGNPNKTWSQIASREIPITEGRILKKDWLMGYKEVKPPKKKEDGGWLDQYEDGGSAESRMGGLTDIPFNYNSAWGGQFQSGGSLPGSVGFTYARTKGIPSEGPYAKKTMPSAQNGMTFYQHGLDWKPRNISQDGRSVKKYDWQVDPRSPLATESTAIRFGPSTTATSGMSRQEMAENAESMGRAKAVENYEKKARVAERKAAVAAKDKGEKFTLPTGETKRYEDMDAREKMYVSGRALGQRGRLNESDETFFDEWINPLNYIGGMAESLGTAPYEAKLYDSNLPYVGAVIDPLIGGISSRLRLRGKGVSPSGVREASPKPPVSAEELFGGPINITPVGEKVMDKELSSHVDAARLIAEYGRPRLSPRLDALNPRPKDVIKSMAEIAEANNPSFQMYYRGMDLGEKLEEFVPFPKSRLYDRKDFYHILRPNKDGGLVKAQRGTFIPRPTETDSLHLYNAQIALNKFYENEMKAGRLRVAGAHPALMRNLNVLRDENLDFYRKEVEYRKDMEDRNRSYNNPQIRHREGVWDDEYKKIFNLTPAQLKKLELQGIGRTKSGNEYQQYYRDLITPLQNLAAPFAMIDSRIKPQREIKYESSDRSGDTHYPGGDVLVYDYNPILIKPYRLLTPEEKKKRDQLTKTKPIPTKPVPTKPKPKPPLKAKEKEKEKQPEVPKMTRKDIEQPIASTAKQIKEQINYNQGTPVYAPTPGVGGSAGSFVGFKDKSGKITYVQPEDYERMGVPKYGREYIEKNIQKKRSGGWLDKYE